MDQTRAAVMGGHDGQDSPAMGVSSVGGECRGSAEAPASPLNVEDGEDISYERMEFSGTGGEYFRIWIVNLFLTIVTLGIYAAWAKVRTRRYFYAHTHLAGHSFDYLADPRAILRGNLIIGLAFILYMASDAFAGQLVTTLLGIAFFFAMPFFIYKSLRFNAHNSAYRNIRFAFVGGIGESYATYCLLPMFLPFTLGLLFPFWAYRRKKYFFGNYSFGSTANAFSGSKGPFYQTYGMAFLFLVLVMGAMAGAIGTGVQFLGIPAGVKDGETGAKLTFIIFSAYLFMLLSFTLIQQFMYARIANYCWQSSALGEVRFQSTLTAGRLVWIRLTNILAIILSLGLLAPWAKVRRIRYILDNLRVGAAGGFDDFTASIREDETAVGDAATDFLDLEVGL